VNPKLLDVIVLDRDLPAYGLRRGDLGTIVEECSPEAFAIEFVAASGRTQALVILTRTEFREVSDDDLVSVRSSHAAAS